MNKLPKGIPRFDLETCIACTMCVYICPTGAIDLETRNSGSGFRRFPKLRDIKKCIGCNSCEHECPSGAIEMVA